ncbi:MAG: hypothetical protein ACRESW_06045 [Nevskiales bacterium]
MFGVDMDLRECDTTLDSKKVTCTAMLKVFEYLYRDASNYKVRGFVLLEGDATREMIKEIYKKLDSRMYFIPEQVGLPAIQKDLFQYSGGPNVDDHVWHEFITIRDPTKTEIAQLAVWGKTKQLLSAFQAVRRWETATYTEGRFDRC